MDASQPVPSAPQTPATLGQYELLGALARGGMATVYLARRRGEAGFQRLFAIKVMHAHLADDEEFVSMMLDEARIAARLHHPNVVPITDLGSQGGIHYVVMEYVEGCSLAALLKKFHDQRPPRLLVAIMLDVLAGLHSAHTAADDEDNPLNLVHRDVSPQNVMVGLDGTARITDFGIARAESRIMSTRPGQLKGKVAFMSPEQIRSAEKIDRRSDLFSAGAMFWSAITGRRLFLADSDAATLSNILQMPIPAPSAVGFKPPAELDPFFVRALERDPNRRYQTAQEMEEALRELAQGASCLGSRREVAAWVAAGFGEDLNARRKAIARASAVGPVTLDPTMGVSGVRGVSLLDGTPSRPGASSPALASSPSVSKPFTPPAGLEAGEPQAHTPTPKNTPSQAPTAVHAYGSGSGKKKPWALLAAAGAVGLLGVLALVFVITRKPATDPVAKPIAAETAAPKAEAPAPSPAAPVAAAPAAPAAPPPVASAAREDESETKRSRNTGRWAGPALPRGKPEPSAKPTAPAAPPPPVETPKKPAIWDKDSPLPPQ